VGDGVVNKEQREKLRELALEATPGEWKVASDLPAYAIYTDSGRRVVQTPNQNNRKQWGTSDDTHGIDRHSDAAYIAAANPVAVLALLDRIDELESAAAEVESAEPVAWTSRNQLNYINEGDDGRMFPEGDDVYVDIPLYRHPPSAVPVAWKLETEGEHIRVVGPDGAVWVYPDGDAGDRVIHAYLHAMLAATGDSHHE
tara:strand:- start:5024 stop:5620 length:597 start_codon:yes stop_codon:yes gene_type:complete